jgi:sugar phosphate isomerase/epimerase
MSSFPIGIMLESFKLPYKEALAAAASLDVQGVQVYATKGDMAPENMTARKRKEFLHVLKGHGLTISALCGDLGHGFGDASLNPGLIERSKRIMDLAKDLETDIITTHIGVVPGDKDHPRYKIMQDACALLAGYADTMQAHFAVETGPETAVTLRGFLDSLHSTGVAINLDPANLVMVTGDDPVKAVHTLRKYIVHTHAKDGRKLKDKDPEKIYGVIFDDAVADDAFIELPLGEGDVPFEPYLHALHAIGFAGFLTIEREVGDDPAGDIRTAVNFLRSLF